jgi:probable HAF family extracellular repeat protein
MCTLRNLGISGHLKSVLCLGLTLSPVLLPATAPRTAAAQSAFLNSNQFAYVANENSNDVSGYILNAATGTLTPMEGSPFHTGKSGPTSVAVDPAGRFLYVTNQNAWDNDVAGFSMDRATGKLTPVPGSPFADCSGPSSIAIDPSGRFAYVSNLGSNSVSAFTIDEHSGRLKPVSNSPYPAGSSPSSVTVDPLGEFVYVTNEVSGNVSGYMITPATGALTPIAGSPFPAGNSPISVAVDPNERFVYVANEGSDDISGYSINPTTGALTTLQTSPYAAGGGGVHSVTVDPTGGFVYLAGSGGVFAYTMNQNSEDFGGGTFPPMDLYGQLTPVAGSPFGGGTPNFVAVDYTGKFIYTANKSSHDVSAYTLSSGVLQAIAASPFPTGSGPVSVALVRPRTIPIYSATEIPDPTGLGSVTSIVATGINNQGQVSGTVASSEGELFGSAFIYSKGTLTEIAFSRFSSGNGINENGQVVGQTNITPPFPGEPPSQAFLYSSSNNATVVIDNVAERPSDAYGINNAGEVTGSLSTVPCTGFGPFQMCNLGDTHAFSYAGAGLVDIGTLGGTFSQGTSINNLDQIVGISTVAGSTLNHVFLYAQDHMYDLGTVPGESFVNAIINDRGEIVGSTGNSSFIRRENRFKKLPFLARSINNSGAIVGGNVVANGSSHAFLYIGGQSIDLNDLVDPSLTLLTSAAGISDNGKIVASGVNGHLYVLTPK